MVGDQFINLFICPFVRFLGRQVLGTQERIPCDDGPLFGFAAFQRDGKGNRLFPDDRSCEQVERGIRADSKLVAKLVELLLDV